MNPEEYLKNRVDDQIQWYDRKSASNQRWFRRLRIVEIVAAALIPLLAVYPGLDELRIVVAFLGLVIAVIAGVLGLFQFQENWTTFRSTSESLKQEKYLFLTKTEPYHQKDPFPLFVQRVEGMMSKERSAWAQNIRAVGEAKNQE
ncbi:MAG: DUF4231 domain-containing protein [Deltaproteobacteria bacterium]|nr:DUF4231 domain-containing protein [Deltaproteobacteria bacterium]